MSTTTDRSYSFGEVAERLGVTVEVVTTLADDARLATDTVNGARLVRPHSLQTLTRELDRQQSLARVWCHAAVQYGGPPALSEQVAALHGRRWLADQTATLDEAYRQIAARQVVADRLSEVCQSVAETMAARVQAARDQQAVNHA